MGSRVRVHSQFRAYLRWLEQHSTSRCRSRELRTIQLGSQCCERLWNAHIRDDIVHLGVRVGINLRDGVHGRCYDRPCVRQPLRHSRIMQQQIRAWQVAQLQEEMLWLPIIEKTKGKHLRNSQSRLQATEVGLARRSDSFYF